MQFRSRKDQSTPALFLAKALSEVVPSSVLTDDLFDTRPLPRPIRALNWSSETKVHGGILLTAALKNANQFVGTQTMVVRDEVRRRTHVVAIEIDGLYHYTYAQNAIQMRRLVATGDAIRAHISLRKFDGQPIVSYVLRKDASTTLHIESQQVATKAARVDFPFFTLLQPTTGYPATAPPDTALLFYKDRADGSIFVRNIDPFTFVAGVERKLPFADVLGGADAEITKDKCVVRAQVQVGGALVSHIVTSIDAGATFSSPRPVDLSLVPGTTELPATAATTTDNTLHFHVPVVKASDQGAILLDILPDDDLVTAAISAPAGGAHALVRFPSMSARYAGFRDGFGDGIVDGSGVIATLSVGGKLLVSNSQSGGYSYPSEAHLNHDVQKVFGFRSTECYTRGASANTVSMDYVVVEADDDGRPVSSELWIDTWDMPLPEPQISRAIAGGVVTLRIERSGWFFHGQTSFELDPPNTFITKVTMRGFREIDLEFDDPAQVRGTTISFETKNAFYHYGAKVTI